METDSGSGKVRGPGKPLNRPVQSGLSEKYITAVFDGGWGIREARGAGDSRGTKADW